MTTHTEDRILSTEELNDSGPIALYRPPIDDILLALDVAGIDGILDLEAYKHVDRSSVQLLLEEFGRIASEQIAPTDRVGDVVGARHDPANATVTMPKAFHRSYAKYVEGGWGALPFPTEFGGGGLPSVVALAMQEMFASANLALSLNPVLTQGAIEALLNWGSLELQTKYLPRLLTGEWTGTMNLTETEAGSDLGEIRTEGRLDDDGSWHVSGTKIFITWGEHDLANNIIHLVLARTPGAPLGTKGLSLFVVPKHVVGDDGAIGERNKVRCLSIEKKLGIHGSPTCVMEFDDALGELVGPLHGGMRAMFTMMNAARLSIGAEGPAVGERAFQLAWSYAAHRLQGRAHGVTPPRRSALIEHPDVRRMLLTMTTTTQASRLLLYWVRAKGDLARNYPNDEAGLFAQQMMDLLTPVAKAWSTDAGFLTASLGVQVLGGAGYVEESGMAQRLRDARIAPIYEGTNGIQALDLVTRKLARDGGLWVRMLCNEISSSIPVSAEVSNPLNQTYRVLATSLATLEATTEWMIARLVSKPEDAVAGAISYLELLGVTMGGWLMSQRARLAQLSTHPHQARVIAESNFFALEVMSRSAGLAQPILAGASRLKIPIGDEVG